MRQLAITKLKGKVISVFLEEEKLDEVFADEKERSILGNIYVGKIQNIVSNIKAAFVDIGGGKMCYLSMKEGIFKCGDEVVVQVSREGIKTKQPTVTCCYNFTGRYFVLSKGKEEVRISAKIQDSFERKRLEELEEKLDIPEGYSLIIRTNAKNVKETELIREYHILREQCLNVEQLGRYKTCYSVLYQAPSPWITYWRDADCASIERVITDDMEIYDELKEFAEKSQLEEQDKLVLYKDESYSLNHLLGIECKIKRLLEKKVWLKSGASLVIEPTEALTSIDVNTEKAIKGNRNPETTFLKINLEATKEVARQMRLRNLSGIIIIDFIDMKDKKHQKEVISQLKIELEKDRLRANVVDMTKLGLVEVTRMKQRKPLHEILSLG